MNSSFHPYKWRVCQTPLRANPPQHPLPVSKTACAPGNCEDRYCILKGHLGQEISNSKSKSWKELLCELYGFWFTMFCPLPRAVLGGFLSLWHEALRFLTCGFASGLQQVLQTFDPSPWQKATCGCPFFYGYAFPWCFARTWSSTSFRCRHSRRRTRSSSSFHLARPSGKERVESDRMFNFILFK